MSTRAPSPPIQTSANNVSEAHHITDMAGNEPEMASNEPEGNAMSRASRQWA